VANDYFDIIVVVPLEEELLEFMAVFPSLEDRSDETTFRHVVDSGAPDIRMLVVQQHGMGKTHATNAAATMLAKYDVGLIVCLGIAGSLSDDMHLGDVCYTGRVVDVLDNAKIVDADEKATTADTELSPTHYTTPRVFEQAFSFIRTQPHLRPTYDAWRGDRAVSAATLVPNPVPAPDGGEETIGAPGTKNGAIVCGMVSKSKVYNEKLRAIDRALLAVETESGGIFSQAEARGVPAMTIRGVSDYADKDKKKLEAVSKGGVRQLAAANAASFLHLQLGNSHVLDALKARRTVAQTHPILPLDIPAPANRLEDVLKLIGSEVDESLRKLSPEYRLQPKGYRLPLPRIKLTGRSDGTGGSHLDPVEVRQGLELRDRLLINLPRTYPDQSMAWIIADDLLTAEINGRQPVPIVIDGEAIRGKQSTFAGIATADIGQLAQTEGVQLVIIVENVPFAFKHRLEALLAEIDHYATAKFVFIARGESDLVSETDFASRAATTGYSVCAISFQEIAHFIQKNFGMNASESEVIALRLHRTFDRFDLDAHPTYFAGIPKQTLSALLQANRRSELIQLAVDGFLTFIVAGDKADVSLSRSTRARFLRKLVVEMRVEKRSFSQAELVAFTKEFAERHDFDIDPLAFITAFVDQGILHFESERVHVSLPFIESYLLAAELAADSTKAIAYFDLNDHLFDTVTFDLYAEIGASEALIEAIVSAARGSSQVLSNRNSSQHILLTEEIQPSNLKRPERADALRKRLRGAVQAVQEGRDNSCEKQEILDLSEKVREASGKKQKIKGHDESDEAPDDHIKPLADAARHWVIATMLLGSGAEHLEAARKRELSTVVVNGAAAIIDDWSRAQRDIDFEAIKVELLSDDVLHSLPGPADIDEKRRFVTSYIELLEYGAMADPIRRVLGFLCEQARHKVLAPSVTNATPGGLMEAVIHGTWLADIDAGRGRQVLRDAIRALPRATFFRMTLASHYLARVYWSHWHKDNRMLLLQAAEDAIEPLEVQINKPELKRLIEREADKKVDKSEALS
jgi:nucleoside phosphorylase